jgi:hypothetical protein
LQKLHVVGLSTEQDALILSARRGSRSGSYEVQIDEDLWEAVRASRHRRVGGSDSAADRDPMRPQSLLTVKEVQARLRAGRAIDEVAAEAGVDAEWVERFAPPVRAEQAQVVAALRSATYTRDRGGASIEPLGMSVQRHLAERGLQVTDEEFDAGWSSYQLFDDRWMVEYRYDLRGRTHTAGWEYDLDASTIVAADRASSALAFTSLDARTPRGARRVPPEHHASATGTDVARRVAAARKAAARAGGGKRAHPQSGGRKAKAPAVKAQGSVRKAKAPAAKSKKAAKKAAKQAKPRVAKK